MQYQDRHQMGNKELCSLCTSSLPVIKYTRTASFVYRPKTTTTTTVAMACHCVYALLAALYVYTQPCKHYRCIHHFTTAPVLGTCLLSRSYTAKWQNSCEMSIPMKFLPSCKAARPVVPELIKQSMTIPPAGGQQPSMAGLHSSMG